MQNGYKEEEVIELTEEEKEYNETMDAKSRMIYDVDAKTIDMGARRATDSNFNRRTHLPKHRPMKEEAEMEIREQMIMKEIDECIKENCDEKGKQTYKNLSNAEMDGFKSLLKRVKEGTIVVTETDKGKTMVVSTIESYEEQGKEHTCKDTEVNWEQVEERQRDLTASARALCKIFGVGTHHGDKNTQRCWDNASSSSCIVPPLKLQQKAHKPTDSNRQPKKRPVVGAASALTSRASETICDIIDALSKSNDEQEECTSTEGSISNLEDITEEVKMKGENVMTGSMDAIRMFPELDIPEVAKAVGEEFYNSDIKVEGADYRTAAIYVATRATRARITEAGLGTIVPKRLFTRGAHPGGTTAELITRLKDKASKYVDLGEAGENTTTSPAGGMEGNQVIATKFAEIRGLSEDEKRRLLAMVIEIAIITISKNHVYTFMNKIFAQKKGGAIGLRITGLIARIYMDQWVRKMKEIMTENLMVIYNIDKYVDDVNVVNECIGKGTKWNGECLNEEWEKKTRCLTRQMRK